jgi:RNA polymerase sigma-70 factor (ECF subfamily)
LAESSARSTSNQDSLFLRARDGDQAAWEELVRHCWPKILRVVRRKLNPPMRTLYDSTDFANDVLTSLVAKCERFDFATFDELVAHLTRAAERKVIDEQRTQLRQKRDIRRDVHIGSADSERSVAEPRAHDPSPSQLAQAREVREQIFEGTSGETRAVLELKAQDYTNQEAAKRVGWNVRAVQRLLKQVRDTLPTRRRGDRTCPRRWAWYHSDSNVAESLG